MTFFNEDVPSSARKENRARYLLRDEPNRRTNPRSGKTDRLPRSCRDAKYVTFRDIFVEGQSYDLVLSCCPSHIPLALTDDYETSIVVRRHLFKVVR